MANLKISQLPSVTNAALGSGSVFPVVDSTDATTKKILVTQLDLRWRAIATVDSIAQGGTGAATKAGGFDALSPMSASGDLIIGGASGTGTRLANGTQYLVPTGAVTMFAGTTAPTGWLLLDGTAVSRTTYAALFALFSTTYGVGDGSTTFNLPDTRGVFVRGNGSQTIGGLVRTGTRGTTQNDQLQGHIHPQVPMYVVVANTGGSPSSNSSLTSGYVPNTGGPADDGTNGTVRSGTETRPANITLAYIVKT